jgi:TatA/E family protein of Tat protein translocase
MIYPVFAFLPSGSEWIWIVLIVVLLFGAKKLPELARGLGRSLGEFKKAKGDFDREINNAMLDEEEKKRLEEREKSQGNHPTSQS